MSFAEFCTREQEVTSTGGSVDADLFVELGTASSISSCQQASKGATTAESNRVNKLNRGTYSILRYAF